MADDNGWAMPLAVAFLGFLAVMAGLAVFYIVQSSKGSTITYTTTSNGFTIVERGL